MAPRKRGMGTSHDRDRRAALAAFRDGDPCLYGRNCLYYPNTGMHLWQALDLCHLVDLADSGGTDTRTALGHAKCNRHYGARASNRRRALRRRTTPAPAAAPVRGYHNPRW